MGSSASATIAWGIELLACEDEDVELQERYEALDAEDYNWIDTFLGWRESHPGWLDENGERIKRDTPEWTQRERLCDDYFARRELAVPIETDFYGDSMSGYTGTILVFKRTKTTANWGVEEVDAMTLKQPTWAERNALDAILDKLGFTGDRSPKLLVFANYG